MNVMVSLGQREILDTLEDALEKERGTLPILDRSIEGYVFTKVDGVTVIIATKRRNSRGGYKVPAIRTYKEKYQPTNLDAAVNARKSFEAQARDPSYATGHFGSIVNLEWSCNDQDCPCKLENYEDRYHRSTGR
jgi:hypothetical protein